MPTDNRRVATYLPKEIDDRFTAFKTERGISGDSQALIAILSEFLGVSQQVAHQFDSGLLQRIQALEDKYDSLKSELLSELESRLSTPSLPIEETSNNVVENLPFEKGQDKTTISEPSGNSVSELPEESVPEGSPLIELPAATKRKRGRPKGSGVVADGSLTTAGLARRLQVDGSSLSHWKPGGRREKTQEEILEATRRVDPEGIGWFYVPEINRFKPERSISSNSPQVLQSELLNSQDL